MKVVFTCAQCGNTACREAGAVNRAKARAMRLYCGRVCSGLARRLNRTQDDKVSVKRAYDIQYRKKNRALLKQKKRDYFSRTYDPQKARVERKRRAPQHAEYCRSPAYRVYKREYDLKRRAAAFGEYSESYELLSVIEREIDTRASRYEIYSANGTLNKALNRRRDYEQSVGR